MEPFADNFIPVIPTDHALHTEEHPSYNEACCATSVIALNPYPFLGGKNTTDFTYWAQGQKRKEVLVEMELPHAKAQRTGLDLCA